jgi:hypothetical protein
MIAFEGSGARGRNSFQERTGLGGEAYPREAPNGSWVRVARENKNDC